MEHIKLRYPGIIRWREWYSSYAEGLNIKGMLIRLFAHLFVSAIYLAYLMRSSGVITLITENYIFAQRRSIGWQKSNDTDLSSSFDFCSPSLVFYLHI